MAVVVVNAPMMAGLSYTHRVDDVSDFPAVPNNTYFYNIADKQVYYKDLTGTVLVIYGTAYTAGGGAWMPIDTALDSWLSNGASTFINPNAGFQKSFSRSANNQVIAELPLDHENVAYDGSGIRLRLSWQLFSTAPLVTDTVLWRLAYVFVGPGEDGDSKPATTVDTSIVVGGRLANQIYVDDLPIMSGPVGSKFLGITLTRVSSGGGSDTYPSETDVFAIEIIKV
jgi:hypothetical protein